ncbi:MAG TPA: fumarylacetoacetate hydrolase family protein [Pyrinomonadaceae bacterium]|nr:fumarylacetoacetate hydrolase family protein [Pyrinomonadaceae bacterium]
MRICRFTTDEMIEARLGLLENDVVFPLAEGDTMGSVMDSRTESEIPVAEVTMLAPVTPSKIVCVGRNYREHAAELGNKMPDEPLLFLKPPSAVISHGSSIVLPPESQQVEHEGELGVVIGRRASKLQADDDPLSYVLGYTCVNDVTARDLQRKDVQFTRGKSFDTFCPVGPSIVTGLDPQQLSVTTRVNGIVKQQGQTSDMAFPVPFLIQYISNIMTLLPGDLIATGTPAGVSPMKPGDVVEVEIAEIGVLRNSIVASSAKSYLDTSQTEILEDL